MEQKIRNLIEKNYKHTTVESVSVVKSNFSNDDCVILRCNTPSYRAPLIALRILNTYPSVRLVQFTGGWMEAVYTRETLRWAGYKVKDIKTVTVGRTEF